MLKKYFYELLADEISQVSHYADRLVYVERQKQTESLFSYLDCPQKESATQGASLDFSPGTTGLVVMNGNLNYDMDIQKTLLHLHGKMKREDRLMAIVYNPYLTFFFKILNNLGLLQGGLPETFLTKNDLEDLCELSGFKVCRYRPIGFFPFKLLGLGTLINKVLSAIPFIRDFALTHVITMRPVKATDPSTIKLSVVIPARNEAGNIENALLRMPKLACGLEVIFIEGNSTDDTWKEINRVYEKYKNQFSLIIDKQPGKGKADAVEKGFSLATGNLLTILDADLTMPPELLPRFVDAYLQGHADFVNGSRLLYPMEGKAMRFLNKLGNIFFAKSLSFVLEGRLTDSLCGTKLFTRKDYHRFLRWREDFGRFDPFGDFDLLFPASTLALGIIDVPIRYLDRTYGETNISRFRHGFMLLKMTLVGMFKIRLRIF